MDTIQYRPLEPIPTCEARAGTRPDAYGFAPAFCAGTRGLRSFFDRQHHRRYFCPARGHRAAVERMYGVSEWHENELAEAFGR